MRVSDWSSDLCSSDLEVPPAPVLAYVAQQLGVAPEAFADYAHRDQTRREHLVEIRRSHGFRIFVRKAFHEVVAFSIPIAKTIQIGRASCRESMCQYV